MTPEKFIKQYKVTMTCERIAKRPDGISFGTNHFALCLHRGKNKMNLYYAMGFAHIGDPKLEDVLDCLGSDANCIDNTNGFEDWASDLGFDKDSRSDEKIYQASLKSDNDLKILLGESGYNALLFNFEQM